MFSTLGVDELQADEALRLVVQTEVFGVPHASSCTQVHLFKSSSGEQTSRPPDDLQTPRAVLMPFKSLLRSNGDKKQSSSSPPVLTNPRSCTTPPITTPIVRHKLSDLHVPYRCAGESGAGDGVSTKNFMQNVGGSVKILDGEELAIRGAVFKDPQGMLNLPNGWVTGWDTRAAGEKERYYVNLFTGKSQWKQPMATAFPLRGQLRISQRKSIPPPPLGWDTQWDERYQEWFYVNVSTAQSQWERPTKQTDPSSASSIYEDRKPHRENHNGKWYDTDGERVI